MRIITVTIITEGFPAVFCRNFTVTAPMQDSTVGHINAIAESYFYYLQNKQKMQQLMLRTTDMSQALRQFTSGRM